MTSSAHTEIATHYHHGIAPRTTAAFHGSISPGDVMMLVAAVGGVQAALAQLTISLTDAHQQLLLFDHFLAVVRAGPDLPAAPEPIPAPSLRSGIELRDVWFRYSPEHPAREGSGCAPAPAT